jgi:hypothetical protein
MLKERDWTLAEMLCMQFNQPAKGNGRLVARPVIDGEIVPDGVSSPSVSVEGIAFINSRTGAVIGGDDTPTEDEPG